MKHPEATSGRRELGAQLRRLRQSHNLVSDHVARQLSWSPSRLSRLENGFTAATDSDIAALLAHYQADEQTFTRLFELNHAAHSRTRVQSNREQLPHELRLLADHEARATRITEYEPIAIPALLQTKDYAHATLRNAGLVSDDMIERRLDALAERQDIVSRPGCPTLRFFISEHVLRAPIGDKDLMTKQLRRINSYSERYECTIRILPAAAGHSGLFGGPFRLMEYDQSPDVACTQNQTSCVFLEKPVDVGTYRAILDRLHIMSLDKEESTRLVNDLVISYSSVPAAAWSAGGAAGDL